MDHSIGFGFSKRVSTDILDSKNKRKKLTDIGF
jgi:hypothetical protein